MSLYALLPLCMLGAFAVFIGWWRLETYRKAAEREASRAWKIAAQESARANALEDAMQGETDALAAPLLREMNRELKQIMAVKARRAQERAHRGSQR